MRRTISVGGTRPPHLLQEPFDLILKLADDGNGVVHRALQQREGVVDGHHHVLQVVCVGRVVVHIRKVRGQQHAVPKHEVAVASGLDPVMSARKIRLSSWRISISQSHSISRCTLAYLDCSVVNASRRRNRLRISSTSCGW